MKEVSTLNNLSIGSNEKKLKDLESDKIHKFLKGDYEFVDKLVKKSDAVNPLRCKMFPWNVDDWHESILRKIELKMDSNYHILDVGCGDGKDCELISTHVNNVIGVDICLSSNGLTKATNLNFIVADACNLPFRKCVYDIVFEKDALHHIRNHKKALYEMKRVVKSHGKVVVVEANRYNPILFFHMTLMGGHQHFTTQYLENLLSYYFGEIIWRSLESHVYPKTNKYFLKLIHYMEDFVAKVPGVKSFLSYNIAICEKNE